MYFWLFEDLFTITNSEDPDEMPHYATFHMGLHCLKKYTKYTLKQRVNIR